jgi:hypothetical protein
VDGNATTFRFPINTGRANAATLFVDLRALNDYADPLYWEAPDA